MNFQLAINYCFDPNDCFYMHVCLCLALTPRWLSLAQFQRSRVSEPQTNTVCSQLQLHVRFSWRHQVQKLQGNIETRVWTNFNHIPIDKAKCSNA